MARERVLAIEHERSAPLGLLGEWLERRGAEVHVLAIEDGAMSDVRPQDYDLIVSLGSEAHAYDDEQPWLARELALLREAAAARLPVLGICFGSQALARALGGGVAPAPRPEIGWLEVRSEARELIPPGPWFQWHFDAFSTPPGATVLASSDIGPQAFVRDRCLGVQFHPEVDPEIVAGWAAASPQQLIAHGIEGSRLVRETSERAESAGALSANLFDAVHARIAGGTPAAAA